MEINLMNNYIPLQELCVVQKTGKSDHFTRYWNEPCTDISTNHVMCSVSLLTPWKQRHASKIGHD